MQAGSVAGVERVSAGLWRFRVQPKNWKDVTVTLALPDAEALAANGEAVPSSGLDAELGYGMGLSGDAFTATPHVGFGLSDKARR